VHILPLLAQTPSPAPIAPTGETLLSAKTVLVLLTGGGLAAVGGLVSGWLTNWPGTKRDERRYNHEQEQARLARLQERLEQAYIELLTFLSHYSQWAESVRPVIGPVQRPDPVPQEERWRMEALLTAYGSDEIRLLLQQWGECATKIHDVDEMMRLEEKSRNPGQKFSDRVIDEQQALAVYKTAMIQVDEAIRVRVRRELAGET
jgi:hypothetical protein